MAIDVDEIIREGIAAYKAGNKEEARSFLLRAVEIDQYSEQAWLWLSAVVDTPADQRTCLENVLAINPANERAQQGLSVLGAPASPPDPSPPAADEFPTSVEWAAEEESSIAFEEAESVTRDVPDESYDDWVANLNLPAPSNAPANGDFPASDTFSDSLFVSNDADFDDEFDGDVFSASPFSTLDFETVFGSSEDDAEMPPPPPDPPAMAASSDFMRPSRETVVDNDPFADIDLEENSVFSVIETDDDLPDVFDSLDTEDLFQYIPPDIKATRLPGTHERYPALLLVGLVVLIMLNVGALALLVYRLV